MLLVNSKWMLVAFAVIAVLLILYLVGKKSVTTEISINASKERVWQLLANVDYINEWNKVLIPAKGNLQEGNTILYEFFQQEGGAPAEMEAKVVSMISMELINQKGGMTGILTFDHKYLISEENGITNVKIHEVYRGIMVPFWNPAPVEKAYKRLLQQLKTRAENG